MRTVPSLKSKRAWLIPVVLCSLDVHALSLKDALRDVAKGMAKPQNTASQPADTPVQSGEAPTSETQGSWAGPSTPKKEFPNEGTWTDPVTGLMWSRCPASLLWDSKRQDCGLNIDDDADRKPWADAVLKVSKLTLYGYSDWRIPTVQEYSTIYYGRDTHNPGCSPLRNGIDLTRKDGKYDLGCGEPRTDSGLFFGLSDTYLWTTTPSPESTDNVMVVYVSGGASGSIQSQSKRVDTQGNDNEVFNMYGNRYLVVRGGHGPTFFADAVAIAIADKRQDAQQAKTAEDLARAKQAQAARVAEQKKQAYMARLAAFQKGIKLGDQIQQGLVIEVKGELVKVQRVELKCVVQRDYSCLQTQKVITGDVWMRRDELLPL